LIEAKEKGVDPFKEIEKVMSWTEFINSVNDASEVARPKEYDYLDLLHTQYRRLRRYTPVLIKSLNFKASNTGQPILNALETIAEVNNSNKKKISKGAPLDFVPKRLEKHVYDEDGNINRQYYELAAFTEFRNAVRSVQAQVKPHSGYLTDLFDVVFNSLCSIAAGASPLLGAVVAETVIYINLYVDLYKRAAIAGLEYSFSGRLAERELESFM